MIGDFHIIYKIRNHICFLTAVHRSSLCICFTEYNDGFNKFDIYQILKVDVSNQTACKIKQFTYLENLAKSSASSNFKFWDNKV